MIVSGVVVKRVESLCRGCEFESCTCHNKNTIGKEGNRKPRHKFHFPGKISETCQWLLLSLKSSMQRNIDDDDDGGGDDDDGGGDADDDDNDDVEDRMMKIG